MSKVSHATALVYDPDQDAEERRGVRKNYRVMKDELAVNANEITADILADKVRQADLLFEKVKGTSEATLDSDVLLQASSLGAQKARAMKSGAGAFDLDDFVSKLIAYMGGRRMDDVDEDDSDFEEANDAGAPLDWEKVGRVALLRTHRVPAMDFMLGPLSIEQKKRVVGKKAKLEKNKEDEKKPQELTEEDITRSENETTKNVAALERVLQQVEGTVNLFRFIVNPNDFGQSVENLFYLSFLIRDGKCALETNDDGEPVIFSCQEPSPEDYADGLKKQQIVMEFDMATWRRAIEVFGITDALIPQRPKATIRIGNKWYG